MNNNTKKPYEYIEIAEKCLTATDSADCLHCDLCGGGYPECQKEIIKNLLIIIKEYKQFDGFLYAHGCFN